MPASPAAPVVVVESYPLTYSYFTAKQSTKYINDTAIVLTKAVTDGDSDNIQKLEVDFVSGFVLGDTFTFTDAHSITGNYDSPSGKLTLTGPTTPANFQLALRKVYFKATSTYDFLDIPNFHNKVVKIIATDVNADASVEELRAINITAPARVFTEWVTSEVEYSGD
ncbi:hypothetical protein TL16_g00381 [Triparma laevis f. inornata]|uniref:Uncharacterized protein n=1 Tax=Triparma laevis f. inornata TaxID=1714386 RepID=A0A9W7DMS5_9STRA|nr:hypothetical protein TL16_g00381 [Triparma laevis f. inornata]